MRERWLWVPVALLPALTLGPLAALRFVDVDEGSYAAAAKLAFDGVVPYRDFALHSDAAPPLRLRRLGGGARRALARLPFAVARLGLVTAVLLTRHLFVRFGLRFALLGSVLFATSTLVFTWYPPMKTFALATALAFGAYVLSRTLRTQGLAPGSPPARSPRSRCKRARSSSARRLAFAWEALRMQRGLLRYLVGFAVALAPTLRSSRSTRAGSCSATWPCTACGAKAASSVTSSRKRKIVANLLGIPTDSRPVPQYLLLGGAAVVAAVVARRERGRLRSGSSSPRCSRSSRFPDTDVHAVLRDDGSVPDRRGRRARPRLAG